MPHDRGVSEPSGHRPDEPRPDLPVSYPPRTASPGHRLGRAEGVGIRVEAQGSETSSQTVLSFRLSDPGTGRLSEVELRGRSIAGTVRDGDWVEMAGEPGRSGRFEPARVTNLTTGSEVTAIGSPNSTGGRITRVVFLMVFAALLVAFVVIGVLVFQGFREFGGLGGF